MSYQPLFDVVLHVYGDPETGTGLYDVDIIDRHRNRGEVIGQHQANSLDDAITFAKGAVTAFMEGTEA